MIVVNKHTGEIQSFIGSSRPNFYGYNRALQARRSIGSLSKIITYLTILSEPKEYHFNTWASDCPIFIKLNKNKYWIPKNNNHHFIGKVMLIDALINSMNIPILNLILDVSLKNIIQNRCNLGIEKSKIPFLPSTSLGAINLTPIEVAQVFQVIADNEKKALLSSVNAVVFNTGKVLY
jgi:penicillin-binding protein 1B